MSNETEVEAAAAAANGHQETGAGAVLSRIEEIAQANAHKKKTFDRAIPVEWDGNVVVRFGRVRKQLLMKVARQERGIDAQFVVEACREVFVKGEDGELLPCREAAGTDRPVRFDGNLADLFKLGDKADTPRKIALRMYQDELALSAAAKAVYEWQTGENLDNSDYEEVEELLDPEDAAT